MATVTLPAADAPTSSSTHRLHLDFLDGLRGIAAVYVVFSHIVILVGRMPDVGSLSPLWRPFNTLFSWGGGAVAIFIVLSGYCLMLPVSQRGGLKGGAVEFMKRRARRILPPYYAALVFSWLLVGFVPHSQHYASAAWPLFAPKVIITHLLLLQNLSPHWANRPLA